MDYEAISQEFVRALRGGRSQRAFSRWLGYRTNVFYTWEAGLRHPTAAELFQIARKAKIEPGDALRRFFPVPPGWLDELDPASPEGVQRLLDDLRGSVPIAELARRGGLDRHAVGRWMSGRTEPRLPRFLQLVELTSMRLVDLLAVFVDPAQMPSVREAWRALEDRRQMAVDRPWAPAVLHAIGLRDYAALPAHRPGWIAARLGISREEEARCVEALERSGQLTWSGQRYQPNASSTVDSRLSPAAGRSMRQHWTRVAEERILAGGAGQFSYNVFSVSREDMERLRQMHLAYFRSMRAVIANSEPCEVVGVANVQLFPLEEPGSG